MGSEQERVAVQGEDGSLVIETEAELSSTQEELMASLLVESIDVTFFLAESLAKAVGPVLEDGGRTVMARYASVVKPDKTIKIKDAVRTSSLWSVDKAAVEGDVDLREREEEIEGGGKKGKKGGKGSSGGWRLPIGLRDSSVFQA